MKAAKTYSNPAEACVHQGDAFEALDGRPVSGGAVRVRIGGLRQIDEDIFELAGVAVREINWELVAEGLGRKFLPYALADQIDQACFACDVAEILADRIQRR